MTTPFDQSVTVAPPIDKVREEAARCAEETAKMERGERGPVLMTENPLTSEFSGEAAGTAAEVAMIVMRALKAQRVVVRPAFCWDMAAKLLRGGWQRGHRLVGHIVNGEDASQMSVRKPEPAPVRVSAVVESTIDPDTVRWLGHWLRRCLNAKRNPEQGRQPWISII